MFDPAFAEVVSGVLICVTGFFAYLTAKHKAANKNLVEELAIKEQSLTLPKSLAFLQRWNSFELEVKELIEEGEIDRFILFRCWNGYASPTWTTAFYQLRKDTQEWFTYVLVPLDRDYQDRLSDMKQNGVHLVRVDEAPPSLIKDVYEGEGVTNSVWVYVNSTTPTAMGSVAHTYFSAANHTGTEITQTTVMKLRALAWELNDMLKYEH